MQNQFVLQRKNLAALSIAAILALLFSLSLPVQAVHQTPLEVDGNATDEVGNGTDWNVVIGAGCDAVETGGGVVKGTCVTDPTSGDQGFQTGGSKDINDINQWGWAAASGTQTPPKNNIVHAFGAVYNDSGNQVLYFGLDREPNGDNGNNTVGFWFLQNKVSLAAGGTFVDSVGNPAHHTDGDLHVVAEFTNGGSISNLKLNKWQGGALTNVFSTSPGTNTGCNTGLPTDSVCVGVNNTSTPLSWGGTVSPSIFFEGGINLTALGFSTNSCLSQFIGETRSSQTDNAQLHDFALGDLSTCGTITIVKDTVPDDSQDFSFATTGTGLSAFSLDDDADGTLLNTKTFTGINPGTYTVTEGALAGFDLTNLVCVDPTTNSTVNLGLRQASIDVAASETVTCTFTNTKRGSIVIVKDTQPNAAQDFSFSSTGGLSPSSFDLDDDADVVLSNTRTYNNLAPGNFSVTEAAQAGYNVSAINCVDPSTNTTVNVVNRIANIVLNAGETVTCTFVNTLSTGHIIVDKVTNPAADSQSFSFTAGGAGYNNFALTDVAAPNDQTLTAGNYSVSETVPSGWDQTSATCVSSIQDSETVGSLELDPGETITCTFTNTKRGHLIVQKTTVPAADLTSFTINATGSGTITGGGAGSVTDATDKDYEVTPGTYNVSETVPSGWTKTGDTCQGVVVAAGQTANCLLTNTKKSHIIVDKVTVPALDPQSFNFTTTGTGYNGFSLTDAAAANNQELNAGAYSVAETAVNGWTQTSAVCDNQQTPGNIQLAAGQTVTCTFTNTKKPTLTVNKVLVPAQDSGLFNLQIDGNTAGTGANVGNGGTTGAVEVTVASHTVGEAAGTNTSLSDYTSAISGDCNPQTGQVTLAAGENKVCTITNTKKSKITIKKVTVGGDASFTFTGDVAGSLSNNQTSTQTVAAGNYSSTETAKAGWDLTSIVCSDGDSTGNVQTGVASFVVAAGEEVTCTFTNTKRSTIIVKKHMVGGTDTFSYTGNPSGSINSQDGTISEVVVPGNYASVEGAVTGWDLTSIVCDDANSTGTVGTATANFIAEAGETVTCTFTNTKRAHIIVNKVTNPSADPQSFDFTTTGAGYAGFGLTDVAAPNDQELVPGSYSVAETAVDGWTQTSATCDQEQTPGNIQLAAGQTVTCTFTNTKKAHIIVDKVTNPSQDSQSFNFTAGGVGYSNFSLTDVAAPNNQELLPGNYSVSETVPSGWDQTSATCDQQQTPGAITLAAGQTVTCTFTNTKRGHIIVNKITVGGDATFDFTTTGSGYAGFSLNNGGSDNQEVAPGAFTVAETAKAGWDSDGGICDKDETPASLDVGAGETVTCTFTNTKRGKIIVEKQTLPDGSGQSFEFDSDYGSNFNLTDGNQNDSGALVPGTYSVDELTPAGWDETSAICDDQSPVTAIVLGAGETVTCVFTNTQRGHIVVDKVTNPASDPQSFDFTAGGNGYTNFALTDVATPNDQEVVPGAYTVSEGAVAGWDSNGGSCDLGETPASLDVGPGETVHCSFTNTKRGKIIVQKVTVGGDAQFEFDSDYGSNFFLGNGGSNDSGLLVPGTYSVDEINLPAGWVKSSATCTDQSPTTAIVLGAGETVTCTFTNNKPGAQIDLSPLTATNKIGDNHVITATVKVHNGDGVYANAADGTVVTFSITNSNGATATFVGLGTCNTTAGSCSVTINSPTAGNVSVHASAGPQVLGVTVNVETDGAGDNSGDAKKDYVNARISITPNTATNEVSDAHEFIVTVEQNTGSGFTPVQNAIVNAIASPVPNGGLNLADCNAGTDVLGQCTLTINSSVAGVFTVIARSTISVSGVEFKLQTNGSGENSDPAVKTYVDAKISLTPGEATNNVNDPHTITATVMEDPGTGPVAAAGETVTFSLANNTANAAFVGGVNTCVTNGSGQCSVDINTATPGSVDIHGSVDVSVSSLVLHRESDSTHGSSGDAHKTYVAGKIIVIKQTLPDGSAQTFDFTASYDQNGFSLKDGEQDDSGFIAPGTYNVSETVPAGWDQTSATCDDQSPVGAISLQAGETVTCTFNNTQRGHLIVEKTTLPTADLTSFTINATGSGTITGGGAGSVTDATDKNYEVTPGTYSVTETVPSGWNKTADTCQGVVVGAGETVHCGFTNVKQGKITIVKDADPNDCQNFSFTMTGKPGFLLDDSAGVQDCQDTDEAQSKTFDNLPANASYTSSETIPNQFWKFDSVACVVTGTQNAYSKVVNVANGVTITLDPGADVTCTFKNIKLSPTRTQGFWQTHTAYTTTVFNSFAGTFVIGNGVTNQDPITTTGKLFGAFYSNIAKKTNNQQRTALDKARMQLAQQLAAAKLNCKAFGCPASVQAMIATADAHYATGTAAQILADVALVDAFNNSGDTIVIGNAGSATPQASKAGADLGFWDNP